MAISVVTTIHDPAEGDPKPHPTPWADIPWGPGHLLYHAESRLAALFLPGENGFSSTVEASDALSTTAALQEDTPVYSLPRLDTAECRACTTASRTSATLVPTTDCNLRCVYCYSRGGEIQLVMSWDIAQAAIDLLLVNALRLRHVLKGQAVDVTLNFTGGGEPTLPWALFSRSVAYFVGTARSHGLQPHVHVTTNCVFPSDRLNSFATYREVLRFGLSLDGPPTIQDAQRPGVARPAGHIALANAREIDRLGFDFGVHATITAASAPCLAQIVTYFAEALPHCKALSLVPVMHSGRAIDKRLEPVTLTRFLPAFLELYKDWGRRIRLSTPGWTMEPHGAHCGAHLFQNFVVSPQGLLSRCQEVTRGDERDASAYVYGRYDPATRTFRIDREAVASQLHALYDDYYCAQCFARTHCAGGCLRALYASGIGPSFVQTPACHAAQTITKCLIAYAVYDLPALPPSTRTPLPQFDLMHAFSDLQGSPLVRPDYFLCRTWEPRQTLLKLVRVPLGYPHRSRLDTSAAE